ncbi:dihydrofolate reductase family protein [Schumannella sp. 10F1B-5-1]|uniref:dihydrofolate reductase family protein n=1 Tax=Schumannella sp. 10F1B-5-1 TaxID=2590780 RepID=UPI0011315B13|nr:dihydrofolate reductase family protein [Schumannella sp. 10F1B-5-1]TPW78381.1 dihydrofolate reductase [Schumannella sp. 10F1B-5-1]
MRDLVYFIAASIDGLIADPTGDFSRFPVDPATLAVLFERYPETCPTHVRAALGITAEPRRFDTVIMGSGTFAPGLDAGLIGGAYPHLRQVVATHRALDPADGVETVAGDSASILARVAELKAEPGRDIWLAGGGDLAAQLMPLIDEVQVKVNPLVLGDGIPLFGRRGAAASGPSANPAADLAAASLARDLSLVSSEPLPGGVVLNTYRSAA